MRHVVTGTINGRSRVGEIWLELDAEEVRLREGDRVVQNGTRHAWRNKSDKPCTMAVVLVGAG